MKKIVFIVWMALCLSISSAQTSTDSIAIKGTVLDYAEGFYSADAARMERAIYPDFNKARAVRLPQTGKIAMTYSTYSGLIEATRSKAGFLEASKRKISVTVLNINGELANAKLVSSKYNDYLQMVKIDDRWKIINVLWTDGIDSPNRTKDFRPEEEKEAIIQSAQEYMNGMYSGDAKRLESVVHPEYNKVTFTKMDGTGKVAFRKQKFSSLIENSYAKIGLMDEPKRIIQVTVIDCMDGLAVVEIFTGSTYEYVQMLKADGHWRIFNSFMKVNPDDSFYDHLPAVVGLPMPDFTLPMYGGGEFSLSECKGKNVLLIFLRGSLGKGWCTICQYSYIDFIEQDKLRNLKKKYNMEVVFVLPYSSDRISDFVHTIPEALQKVESWKSPAKDATLQQRERAEYSRQMFHRKCEFKVGDIQTSLPILIDADRTISKKLKLFTTYWDQVSSEQNIPTTFIIDKNGIVAFKYQSQTTFDRPSLEYLESILRNM